MDLLLLWTAFPKYDIISKILAFPGSKQFDDFWVRVEWISTIIRLTLKDNLSIGLFFPYKLGFLIAHFPTSVLSPDIQGELASHW